MSRMTGHQKKSYFITIRKHQVKDYVDVQEIMNVLSFLMDKLPSLRLGTNSFEIDHIYNQLHFHGIVTVDHSFRYKGLTTYIGFRIYWKPIYAPNLLEHYIKKDAYNEHEQSQIIDTNYYNHHYGFL